MALFFKKLVILPRFLVIWMIDIYQFLLSPDHSWLRERFPYGYCRHYPTCSEYSRQSFLKFGLIKGLFLSVRRLSNCNPWAEPSIDLVP